MMKRAAFLLIYIFTYTLGYAGPQEFEPNSAALKPQIKVENKTDNVLQKIKVSGYIQSQFKYIEKDANLNDVTPNENKEKSFNRIGIRRGRIKFVYEEGVASGVFQLDITEKGVGIKDAYLNLKDPWFGTNAFRTGVFNRPFGYEIGYSSSLRESPERSTIFQTLFPGERDLGGMFILQAPKTSPLSFLKLEAGLFAGNGIKQETDNRKDFIGHLFAKKQIHNNIDAGFGVSYYNGGVYQGSQNVYTMQDKGFVLNNDASHIGKFAKREYFGVDGQLNIIGPLGNIKLGGEYLWGTQPGSKLNSKSPNVSILSSIDTYIRNFNGGYVIVVQDINTSSFSIVLKFDWYNPNTEVAKNEIGKNGTGIGDIYYKTFGMGLLWSVTNSLRLQTYYEFVNNEKSENLSSHYEKLKDNVFTLRLQYKF